ncbi:hypothetical protein ASNO1_20670 [Corallococcus caeni]|uniref:Uncharacterized protein n=1 Tax=Corallococcus caeni TaxID=3082388 RepID=A0ABQ6QP74_9BACT|nr:hypothetical protein ASNO1_20670 [Corallococcus sp. NO1]
MVGADSGVRSGDGASWPTGGVSTGRDSCTGVAVSPVTGVSCATAPPAANAEASPTAAGPQGQSAPRTPPGLPFDERIPERPGLAVDTGPLGKECCLIENDSHMQD